METGKVLELHVYPPAKEGAVIYQELYSDAGDGYGDFCLDRFSVSRSGNQVLIENAHEGGYPLPYEVIAVQVHGMAVKSAVVDGEDIPAVDNRIELDEMPKTLQLEG